MKPYLCLLAFVIISSLSAQSQTTSFKESIRIKKTVPVFYTVEVENADTITRVKGSILSYQKKYTYNEVEYTVTVTDTIDVADFAYGTKKVVKQFFPPINKHNYSKALVTPDEDDPSILRINYWLDPIYKFCKKSRGIILECKWVGNSTVNDTITDTTFSAGAKVNLTQVCPSDTSKSYFKNSTYRVIIYKENSTDVNFWLIKAYDERRDYFISLKNRESRKFTFTSFEMGALTIPFKFRPGFTRNGIDVEPEFTADFNIGTYFGATIGNISYLYEKNKVIDPKRIQGTVGGFFTVSRVEIDSSSSSTAGSDYLRKSTATAAISPGIAGMLSIYGFKIGFFVGMDIAIGDKARRWNYNYYPWLGFGIGYNVGLIWDK